jgi:transglutaminase-like putative cysteine protease
MRTNSLVKLILFCLAYNINAANIYYCKYSGSAVASYQVTETYTFTAASGYQFNYFEFHNYPKPALSAATFFWGQAPTSDVISSPGLTPVSLPDLKDNNGITYKAYQILASFNPHCSSLTVTVKYNVTIENALPNDFSPTDIYPINTASIPTSMQKYINPTKNCQSNNQSIINTAKAIVGNSTLEYEAISKLSLWIQANLLYDTHSPTIYAQDAVNVLTNINNHVNNGAVADCDGFSNLMIAFLRSINIPARYMSGVILGSPYEIPSPNGTLQISGTSDFHAAYQAYYPSINKVVWGDAQRSIHFLDVNTLMYTVIDDLSNAASLCNYNYVSGAGPQPTYTSTISMTLVNPINMALDLKSSETFATNLQNNEYLFGIQTAYTLGDFSVPVLPPSCGISIPSGPTQFSYPGTNATYKSSFTCQQGATGMPPTKWNWSLSFNHQSGTYLVSSFQYNGSSPSTWSIPAFTLPTTGYKWKYSGSGLVYGQISVSTDMGYSTLLKVTYAPQTVIPCIIFNDNKTISTSQADVNAHYFVQLSNDQITNTGAINFKAGQNIIILPETKILPGSKVNITIDPALQ